MLDQVETKAARTNLAPIPMECDAPHLKIVGELPRELNGTLYRNGPNPQFEAPGSHWFLGDGMLHAFHLENGRASYRNRWVRTPKWQAEHDAGRALFGGFGGRKLPDAPATSCTDSGVANTNIIFHGGRLLALEEGHLPTEIEPGTLNRLGYCDYGKGIAGPFTAHPKIDPVTGEMVFFGYNAAGPLTPALSFGSVNAVRRGDPLRSLRGALCQHGARFHRHRKSSAVSDPAHHRQHGARDARQAGLRLGAGKRRLCRRHEAQRFGQGSRLVPRRELLRVPRHECLGRRRRIIADVMQFEEAPLFTHPDGSPTDPAKSRARLCRWTFDLAGNTDRFTQTYLDDITGEFPRIDDRRAGLKSAHGWYACANHDLPMFGALSGIVHVDGKGSRLGSYLLPAGDTISEPVFVERGKDAAEGDGWLLAAVWRARENRSDLAVFNATDVDAGPVALVQLGHRVPDGFHGNWVGAA